MENMRVQKYCLLEQNHILNNKKILLRLSLRRAGDFVIISCLIKHGQVSQAWLTNLKKYSCLAFICLNIWHQMNAMKVFFLGFTYSKLTSTFNMHLCRSKTISFPYTNECQSVREVYKGNKCCHSLIFSYNLSKFMWLSNLCLW